MSTETPVSFTAAAVDPVTGRRPVVSVRAGAVVALRRGPPPGRLTRLVYVAANGRAVGVDLLCRFDAVRAALERARDF
jgi:hypothetical protein